MRESVYQAQLIKTLRRKFKGCVILKNDADYLQGIPDLLILYENTWFALEVKPHGKASVRPNQNHYIDLLDDMSFAAFIYPENQNEVLYDLQQAFQSHRSARVPKR